MGFIFFAIILFFLSSLLDYAELTYFWQLKEYRLDRFRDFLNSVLGRQFLFSYKIIFRPLVFLLLIFSFPAISALSLVFFIDIFKSLFNFFRGRFNRPAVTAKAVLIILAAVALEAFIFLSGAGLLAFSRFLIVSLIVLILNSAGFFIKKIYYKRAATKLAEYKNLTVIGVTGSYGKTTVKNFLARMLSAKFKVIAPPKNINTELGIARFVLKTDFSGVDLFVVEMAAYKIGEIKTICEMTRPKIGVLTAINEQHLPLFGSLKNTQAAKYELLRALPADGLGVANADNNLVRELLPTLNVKVKTFGQKQASRPDCLIKNVNIINGKLEFAAELDNETVIDNYEIKTSLIGQYNAMNLAPALIIAEYLGMNKEEITKQALSLELPEATMQIKTYGRSTIIDDSYNSSPEAFKVAVKYFAEQKTAGKKIVITRGMIELGAASKTAHEKIGGQIAQTADELIIISPDSLNDLKAGVGQAKLKIATIYDAKKLLEYLRANKTQTNLILLEGRMPKIIKEEIL